MATSNTSNTKAAGAAAAIQKGQAEQQAQAQREAQQKTASEAATKATFVPSSTSLNTYGAKQSEAPPPPPPSNQPKISGVTQPVMGPRNRDTNPIVNPINQPSTQPSPILQPSKQSPIENKGKAGLVSSEPPPRNRDTNPLINTPEGRAASAKASVEANQRTGEAFTKSNIPANAGFGFGGGSIKFDTKGNTLFNDKIISFAGKESRNEFLAEQGLGNNATVVNQAKFAFADFRPVANYDIGGSNQLSPAYVGEARVKFEKSNIAYNLLARASTQKPSEPKPIPNEVLISAGKSGNVGQNKLGVESLFRGSAKEDQARASEANRASKYYSSSSNIDYFTGGKSGSSVPWVPPVGNIYKNMGQGINNSLVRNSPQEAAAKISEANRATSLFYNAKKDENPDYITGGTPSKNYGGVVTPQSAGKSYGYSWVSAQLGQKQLVRNSPQENIAQGKEVAAASSFVKDTSKPGYVTPPLSGLVDLGVVRGNQVVFTSGAEKTRINKPIEQIASEQYTKTSQQTELANGSISLSNKQIAAKNIKSQKEFTNYLAQNEKQGATFEFYSGNKKVGQTSGPRTYHDFLSYQKKYGNNLTVQTVYPEREKAFTKSIQQNTDYFATLPQSYFTSASNRGYFSERNARSVNKQFDLNAKIGNRENLGLLQGSLFAENRGGIIPTKEGPKVIGPAENEVASFIKFPFAGKKVSTSTIPSTSFTNVAQFYPGIPVIDRLAGPASEWWVGQIAKTGIKAGEAKTKIENRVKTSIGSKAFEESALGTRKPVSFEPRTVRQEKTFRPTNPTRTKIPSDVFSSDIIEGRPNVSARQNIPRNTAFEDTTKETQAKLQQTQKGLLIPKAPSNNPPASRNIPFFPGRRDKLGRLFTSNNPAVQTSSITGSANEAANISGLSSGISPIRTTTDVSTTGLSPTSSEFYGVQFQGTYPASYLPPAAGQIGSSTSKVVQPDFFYSPARKTRNIDLGFGEQPRESVSASPDLIGTRKSLVKENQSIFLSKTQSELLTPSKKQTFRIFEQKTPEETNPLGRRGKPPVKSTNPLDITQTPRSEFVERGRVKAENEVFTSRGTKIRNERGDILFGDLSKPQGALRSIGKAQKSTKSEVNLPEQKDYQDWRFQKRSSEGPFNFGFRVGKPRPEVNLGERKDYQDWRFSKFLEKNPQPEKTGESQSRLTEIEKAGIVRANRERKLTKPSKVGNEIVEGNVRSFFANENKMFSEHRINLGKGIGNLIPKTGGRESLTRTFKKPPPPSFTRTFEEPKGSSKETSSGLLLLLKEPKTVTKTPQILRKPKPTSTQIVSVSNIQKPRSGLNQIMSGFLRNIQKQRSKPQQITAQRRSQIFKPISKQQSDFTQLFKQQQKPKQTQNFMFKPLQTPKQGQSPKQIPRLFQSPKQGQTPKQTLKLMPKLPTPQRPRQTPKQPQTHPTPHPTFTPLTHSTPPPPKALFPPFGSFPKSRKGKSKEEPTGLIQLNVNNIFASSLNINVAKNKRYIF